MTENTVPYIVGSPSAYEFERIRNAVDKLGKTFHSGGTAQTRLDLAELAYIDLKRVIQEFVDSHADDGK